MLETARRKYQPENVKVVFIAEAAPDSVERFFYYEDVREKDYLFLGIIGVIYPEIKEHFIKQSRDPKIKENILNQFQNDGYFLLDLFELPKSLNADNENQAISKLIDKLEKICLPETIVILIKANVYDIAYNGLKRKFNVINKRIDFPSSGHQTKFHVKFKEALKIK